MDRFDKFTDQARQVLTFAQGEAQRFGHNYIGTEHILLGLLRVEDGVAAQVLRDMDVEVAKVRTAVEFIIGRGDRPMLEAGLTPRGKRVIELAITEARNLGSGYLGTEHLLLGLVREGEGIAAGVLESLGVDLEKVRSEVTRIVGATPTKEPLEGWLRPMTIPVGSVSIEEARRSLEVVEAYWAVQASPLRRVIGVGMTASDSGISVELIAIEVRATGAVVYWKAHPEPGRTLGEPEIRVEDDQGTAYSTHHIGGSGSGRETKGEVLLVPAPPDTATEIRVAIARFAGRQGYSRGEEARGAWAFSISLR